MRTRFAPNVSGALHLGNARTALFNYLWAKASGADFWLRLDDDPFYQPEPGSEAQFYKGEVENRIAEDLHWLGLEWTGCYRLSERRGLALWYMDNYEDSKGLRTGLLLKDMYLIPESKSTIPAVVTGFIDDIWSGNTIRVRGQDLKSIIDFEKSLGLLFGITEQEFPDTIWVPTMGNKYDKFHKSLHSEWTIKKFRDDGVEPNEICNYLFWSMSGTRAKDESEMMTWILDNIDQMEETDHTEFKVQDLQNFVK